MLTRLPQLFVIVIKGKLKGLIPIEDWLKTSFKSGSIIVASFHFIKVHFIQENSLRIRHNFLL